MPFVAFANTYYFEIVWAIFQQTCVNTLYVRNLVSYGESNMDDLAQTIITGLCADLTTNLSDSLSLSFVRGRMMNDEVGIVKEYTPGSAVVGDLTSPALPLNCSLAIKFGSGLAGRKTRGRNFIVGLTEGQVVGNEITSGARDLLVAAYTDWGESINPVFGSHVVASRADALGPVWTGDTYEVKSYSADTFVDSQRRRLSGRGS